MKLRRLLVSLGWVLLGGCSFQASCGTTRTLNMTNARAFVRDQLAKDTGVAPTVECPAKVKGEKGARFDCTATFDGARAVVTLEQNDDEGYVTVVSVKGILIMHKLQAVIVERLGAPADRPVQVDCGPPVRPSNPGDKFRCTARAGGDTAEIEVTVKDETGNVDFAMVGGAPPAPPEAPPEAPGP